MKYEQIDVDQIETTQALGHLRRDGAIEMVDFVDDEDLITPIAHRSTETICSL